MKISKTHTMLEKVIKKKLLDLQNVMSSVEIGFGSFYIILPTINKLLDRSESTTCLVEVTVHTVGVPAIRHGAIISSTTPCYYLNTTHLYLGIRGSWIQFSTPSLAGRHTFNDSLCW